MAGLDGLGEDSAWDWPAAGATAGGEEARHCQSRSLGADVWIVRLTTRSGRHDFRFMKAGMCECAAIEEVEKEEGAMLRTHGY